MTSPKPLSFEEKLRLATRMPQPRPEFLESLRLRLAAQRNPSSPDSLRQPAPRRTHPAFQMAAFALGLIALILIVAFAMRLIPPSPQPAVGNQPTSTPTIEQTPASVTPTPQPTIQPTPSSTPAGAWISLSTSSGGPGTTVQVSGYYPGGLPPDQLQQQNYLTHADICWGGCTNGLPESALEVNWSQTEPGRFSLQFVVPTVPWLANDGVHKLQAGDIPISLRNLDPNEVNCTEPSTGGKVCTRPSEIGTTFHLTEGYSGPECPDASACGRMTLSPAQGAPGDTIQVQGWAPLVEIIGQPFGYYVELKLQPNATASADLFQLATVQQSLDGSFTASFQVPQSTYSGSPALTPGSYTLALEAINLGTSSSTTNEKSFTPVLIAPTQFDITAAPGWAERSRSAPLWIQPSSSLINETLATDPSNPQRLAYCSDSAIRLSEDGGQIWSSIPTTSVSSTALPGNLTLFTQQQPPRCASVILDPSHPDSFYAVFEAMMKEGGAPPIYYVGLYTTDRGKTWQVAPITQSIAQGMMQSGTFGGFFNAGAQRAVQILYYDALSTDPTRPAALKVSQTTDGGATWTPAALTCPSSGPCLQWGASPSMIGGMGSPLPQGVLASFDGGQSWSDTGQSAELRMPGPHELVGLSPNEALLISGQAQYPLLYTTDGGKTWQALALPPLPGANSGWPNGYEGLQMLPDGALLAMNPDSGVWLALPPSSPNWCTLKVTAPGMYPTLLQSLGDRVWWFSNVSGQPESAPLSSFSCQ